VSRLVAKAAQQGSLPPPTAAARADAIAAIEAAIVKKAERRRALHVGLLGLAVAAAVALFSTGPVLHPAPAPVDASRTQLAQVEVAAQPQVVVHALGQGARIDGAQAVAAEGAALLPGARVVALPHGHAMLAFASGSMVTVEEGGEVTMIEAGASQVLALGAGALRADVAKLAHGERFVVRTQDAEVEVHGTSFRVATVPADAACGAGTRTRVEVYAGVVTVRSAGVEARVPAGEHWPQDCVREQASAAAREDRVARVVPSTTAQPQDAAKGVLMASELAAQNDAFALATAARRAGQLTAAVTQLETLLARYPRGPLAEDAMAERMKLLRSVDAARAQAAARGYLARYPRGFARADAEATLTEAR
jgi:hypothetical protein